LSNYKKNYEIFSGKDLEIADLIQKRRLQLLVHSCVYYELNQNIITDRQWDMWAKELLQLQKDYPEISEKVIWYDAFKDWDASTGAFLPLKDEKVIKKAKHLLYGLHLTPTKMEFKEKKVESKPKSEPKSFSLF
jgi:hypothetical protein